MICEIGSASSKRSRLEKRSSLFPKLTPSSQKYNALVQPIAVRFIRESMNATPLVCLRVWALRTCFPNERLCSVWPSPVRWLTDHATHQAAY